MLTCMRLFIPLSGFFHGEKCWNMDKWMMEKGDARSCVLGGSVRPRRRGIRNGGWLVLFLCGPLDAFVFIEELSDGGWVLGGFMGFKFSLNGWEWGYREVVGSYGGF